MQTAMQAFCDEGINEAYMKVSENISRNCTKECKNIGPDGCQAKLDNLCFIHSLLARSN